MDKITSGIIDKLSLLGFFNVMLSGAILLYGISPILNKYAPGLFYIKLGVEKDFEKIVVICIICFVLGYLLQTVQAVVFKGMRSHIVAKCLVDMGVTDDNVPLNIVPLNSAPLKSKSVLANQYHRKGLTKMAEKLFAEKELGDFDPNNKEMCKYFFDYCVTSNSIRGYSSKASQSSEAANVFEQLAVTFYILTILGIVMLILGRPNVLLYSVAYMALGSVFTGRAYQARLNWAKAVLSTYEVATDQDMNKKYLRL